MMFIFQPYAGLSYFSMDNWNEYVHSLDSAFTEDGVQHSIDRVSHIPEYGLISGVGIRNFLFLIDIRPVSLNRKIWAKDPDWTYTLNANLSGAIIGAVIGTRKNVGPVEISAYTRLLYPILNLSWNETWFGWFGSFKLNASMRPERTVGGGFAIEVAYRIHRILSIGLSAGYDHLVLKRYKGKANMSGDWGIDTTYNAVLIYYNDGESIYVFPLEEVEEEPYWPSRYSQYFKDNLTGARLRFFIRINLGGGR